MHPVAEPTCTECRAHSSTRCKTGRPRNVRQFVSAGRATNKTKAFEWRRHFSGSQIATGVRQEMTYLHVHTQRLGGPLYSSGINFSPSPPSPPHPGFHFIPPSPGHSSAFCLTNQRGGFLSIRAPGGWQLPCQTMQTGPSDNFHDAVSIDWQPAGLPFRQSEPPIGRVRRAFSTSTYYYRKRAHWMEPAEATPAPLGTNALGSFLSLCGRCARPLVQPIQFRAGYTKGMRGVASISNSKTRFSALRMGAGARRTGCTALGPNPKKNGRRSTYRQLYSMDSPTLMMKHVALLRQ